MSNRKMLYSLLIGILFGVLFSATLGLDFFGSNMGNEYVDNSGSTTGLRKDEAAFKLAYNLDDSVFVPITGEMAYDKIDDDETFVLYAGRETCPFCQQYVPKLQEAAENLSLDMIYYIDTTDPLNETFVDDESVNTTPTTFIVVNGVIVETIKGFKTTADIQLIIDNHLS